LKNWISRIALLVCTVVVVIAGCASADRVVRLYEDPSFDRGPLANVLVVGVHENATLRRRFESNVAERFRATSTGAVPSLNLMRAADAISHERLVAIVQRERFDAVLVSRLVDVQTRVETREGRTTAVAQRRDNIPLADFFRYDYVEYQDPMEVTTVRTVVLVSDLYDVATEQRVWSAETTSFEKTRVDEIIDGIATAVTGALRRDGFVR
jgi:hypothetical protein